MICLILKVIGIAVVIIVVVVIFYNRTLVLNLVNTDSLPVYIAIRGALDQLNRENTKENRAYIRTLCCHNNRFTDDFCNYADASFVNYFNIDSLGFVMAEYVIFKEHVEQKEGEYND